MKKNNFSFFCVIIAAIMLLAATHLFGNQLPMGKSNRPYEKWEWNDATMQSVMSHISLVGGVDIVVDSKLASEKVRLSLKNRTWQDVLKIVCQIKGLTYRMMDEGYIYVVNEKDLNQRLIDEAQSARNLETLEELERFTIKLKNTTAKEMEAPIKAILSTRGRVNIVEHNNSLVISELSKHVNSVKEFIEDMDKEMLQISISAKIVEITSGLQNQMGVRWSFFDDKGSDITQGGTQPTILSPVLTAETFGILDNSRFNIALEYLLSDLNSELVAEPQITTLENKEAVVYMKEVYKMNVGLDFAGNELQQDITAETRLTVTPTVTGQGQIKMLLNTVKSSVTERENQVPIINTQEATTNVVVQDGETIVIAGLTRDDINETESGIPFLKDIPIIGYFFKRRTQSNTKRDLVFFVTPHIIKTTRMELAKEEFEIEEQPQVLELDFK
ncbi:MAG: hypothetical protein FWF51_00560 [Chitinivibrionia bacterium]|nr:hypothetical protein [Chitinivibrionia bacterium]